MAKEQGVDQVSFVDPNWSFNNGMYTFPMNVIKGWQLGLDQKFCTVRESTTIRDRELFKEWSNA